MTESKIHPNIIISQDIVKELLQVLERYHGGNLFLLTDTHTEQFCLPHIQRIVDAYRIKQLMLPSGEENKTIRSVEKIWNFLMANGADRSSLLVNLGGGVLSDLGGFAASTFKRGIDFMNIPTTLLAQVDASLGGKTGVNFGGIKNQVGAFKEPVAVIVNTNFLQTLERKHFLSGYAEMIKHGIVHSAEHFQELLNFDLRRIDYDLLQKIIRDSIVIKEWFVMHDLQERDIRKALNFGHTIGHAFESYSFIRKQPLLHGYAVAHGMIVELFLSVRKCGFDPQEFSFVADKLISLYGKIEMDEKDYPFLWRLLKHDKKNQAGKVNFTLIPSIGQFNINQFCVREEVFEAFDHYRTLNQYV